MRSPKIADGTLFTFSSPSRITPNLTLIVRMRCPGPLPDLCRTRSSVCWEVPNGCRCPEAPVPQVCAEGFTCFCLIKEHFLSHPSFPREAEGFLPLLYPAKAAPLLAAWVTSCPPKSLHPGQDMAKRAYSFYPRTSGS